MACILSEWLHSGMGVWRNGSSSDSRSEGWEFESLCLHFHQFFCSELHAASSISAVRLSLADWDTRAPPSDPGSHLPFSQDLKKQLAKTQSHLHLYSKPSPPQVPISTFAPGPSPYPPVPICTFTHTPPKGPFQILFPANPSSLFYSSHAQTCVSGTFP